MEREEMQKVKRECKQEVGRESLVIKWREEREIKLKRNYSERGVRKWK